MKKRFAVLMAWLMTLLPALSMAPAARAIASPLANVGGKTYASAYANWPLYAVGSPTAAGTATLSVAPDANGVCQPTLPDGTVIANAFINGNGGGTLYTPLTIGQGANLETVTPTAVSMSTSPCTITATFGYTHGAGDLITS